MSLGTEELLRLTVSALMSRVGERQGDLAVALGQAQAQVSRKQSGKQHWTLDDVDRLAAHYGLGVLDLLAGPTHAVTALSADRDGGAAQASLPLAVPPAESMRSPAPMPRGEALGGPCVLCGEPATEAVEGMWQHLTSEECAEALDAAAPLAPLADYAEGEHREEEFTPAGPGESVLPGSEESQQGLVESDVDFVAPAATPTAPVESAAPNPGDAQPESAAVRPDVVVASAASVAREPVQQVPAPELASAVAATGAAVDQSAPTAAPAVPAPAPELEGRQPTASVARVPGYASGSLVDQIHARVRDVLNEHQGDVEAAQAALIKRAIPDVMALFERSRVGGRYAHSKFPPTDDILRKKSQKGADEIWEGRPKWRNKTAFDAAKKGEQIEVTALDMNAAYLSAFKCWLPVGKLVEDTTGVHEPRKSGVYQITPAEWTHANLPNPLGNRQEPGPLWVPDSLVRLLLDCAQWGLCEAPVIHRALLSGGTESLLEKLRRALAQARKTAVADGDEVAVEYVKSMYSKFVSTIGESSANTDIRRPDWMHIIRAKAFTNLWRKAYKANTAGLTVMEISGTDELHVAGDWRPVFAEGRDLNQVKEKKLYTLGGKR
ncbi:acyltransferase [Streptomyces sp. NPDC056723]|uniref:acyltransferase n=1 Tax=Streptomyces sp. NPDC056723 TaxID=3345925 RepID=UPI0036CF0CC6